MPFRKVANVETLGYSYKGNWKKTAGKKQASFYIDGGLSLDIEAALDVVADTYAISRDPSDYLLIPTRANSANRPNDNLDGWTSEELLEFDPHVGCRRYSTYDLKPHYVNHQAENPRLSRGVILDSHYNSMNDADAELQEHFFNMTGREITKDEFIETLIAMDTTKDPMLAEAYKNGSTRLFSMGCDVEATKCSIPECGNVATSVWQFCDHIKNKHAKRPVKCEDGIIRTAHEWCLGTMFAEESVVDGPADKEAAIQDGILQVSEMVGEPNRLTAAQKHDIISFVAKYSREIPDALAGVITEAISR
jgi:hypothetical protein